MAYKKKESRLKDSSKDKGINQSAHSLKMQKVNRKNSFKNGKVKIDMRKQKGDLTKESIIIEAINLFGKNGYNGTSTRLLAEAAKCNLGLISFHFGNKQKLYNIAMDRVKSRLSEIMTPCIACLEESCQSPLITNKELYNIVINSIIELSQTLVGMEQIAGHALLLLRDFQENTIDINATYVNVFSPLIKSIEKALNKATECKDPIKARLYAFLIVNAGLEFLRNYPIFYPKNKDDLIERPNLNYVVKLLVTNLLNEL